MAEHFDIGLVGWWYGENYGSMLTYFALHQAIKKMGYSVYMIHEAVGYPKGRIIWNNDIAPIIFAKEHYQYSPQVSYKDLWQFNEVCDTFICGSDQLWNPLISRVNSDYFLDFTAEEKKRISYGTSFGNKNSMKNADKFINENRKNIIRFDAVSVREDYAVNIARDYYGIKADHVVDPVFLIDKSEYEILAEKAGEKTQGDYLLAFILDPTEEKRERIRKIADNLGLEKIYVLSDPNRKGVENAQKIFSEQDKFIIINEISPMNFLYAYRNAKYVVTDSFHGSCFAYIFRKDFNVFFNVMRGSDRFASLINGQMDLEKRRIYTERDSEIDLSPVDYSTAEKNLGTLKDFSIKWLKNALDTPKGKLKPTIIPPDPKVEALHKNPDFIKIRILATLLRDYGIKHIVLSPGGRDVPLVRMFEYNAENFILHRVTDERSAAYYALGIAAQTKQPAVCVCTSGTAVSNYLPAITEAYYTGVPLIAVTADRYQVYLNQGEDQTIPQRNIFNSVVKKSVTVPEGGGYKAEYQTRRDISDCIIECTHNGFGPVHINISIDNISIGESVPRSYWRLLPFIYPHILRVSLNSEDAYLMRWVNELKKSRKILLVYGQNPPPTAEQLKYIEAFASKYNCVIVTDYLANLDCAYSLKPHNMLNSISSEEFDKQIAPDILISVGGKRLMNDPLTFKIRGSGTNIRHWSVTPSGNVKDFYFRLSSVLEMSQDKFFRWFSDNAGDIRNNGVYYTAWKALCDKIPTPQVQDYNAQYINSKFIPMIPENSLLHLGVGMSFFDCRRYPMNKSVEVFCNMGTNGIDGCTSTFMGQCYAVKDRLCFLLVGDLSFFYDMNGIWNKNPENNVRILMVNNNGTGLLRGHNLNAISSVHNTSARGWVESVGFSYMSASSKEEYESKLKTFVSDKAEKALFFEVFCD